MQRVTEFNHCKHWHAIFIQTPHEKLQCRKLPRHITDLRYQHWELLVWDCRSIVNNAIYIGPNIKPIRSKNAGFLHAPFHDWGWLRRGDNQFSVTLNKINEFGMEFTQAANAHLPLENLFTMASCSHRGKQLLRQATEHVTSLFGREVGRA